MSKRTKISFETINKGNYTVIPDKDIADVNKRISAEMKPIIKDFERKQTDSWNTLKDKVSENRIQDYNQILLEDTADLTYYENNVINQSNINENAYDVVNQIDLVDYGNVTTGMDKCNLNCDGVCLELGYTGSATCFPKTTPFDYGTLYKNPTFTYGLDQKRFVKI